MDKKFKRRWIAALRSGKYAQGRKTLCALGKSYDKFCCLGVACDLIDKKAWKTHEWGETIGFYSDKWGNDDHKLPYRISDFIGLSPQDERDLIILNDKEKRSLKYIANYIEKYL